MVMKAVPAAPSLALGDERRIELGDVSACKLHDCVATLMVRRLNPDDGAILDY